MLKITSHQGFHITFANGWTASVQFGPGNYCTEHHWDSDYYAPEKSRFWEASDAEIAAWPANKEMVKINEDTVKGWVSPDNVLVFLNWVAGENHNIPPNFIREDL